MVAEATRFVCYFFAQLNSPMTAREKISYLSRLVCDSMAA